VAKPPILGQGVRDVLRNIDAEFGQETRDHIDQLSALPDEEITSAMQRQRGLLLHRLDRDEAHGRPGHHLANRLRVPGVGLAPSHIWLDVGWRHQSDLVAKTGQLSRPMVGWIPGRAGSRRQVNCVSPVARLQKRQPLTQRASSV